MQCQKPNLINRIAGWINDGPVYTEDVGFEINARKIEKHNRGVEVIDMD